MQIVRLDLDHDNFFCPATGKPVFDEGGVASPAVDFVYIYEVGEIDYASAEAEAAWEGMKPAPDEDEDDFEDERFERFVETYDRPNVVCFEITTHGLACCPVSSTVAIGIDMNYDIDDHKAESGEA